MVLDRMGYGIDTTRKWAQNPDGSVVAVVYASAAKSNYAIAIAGKLLRFAMPADGWATLKVAP